MNKNKTDLHKLLPLSHAIFILGIMLVDEGPTL